MTPEEMQRLVASGETLTVEFKGEERSPLNDRELVEAVVCLANRTGTEPAWLIVGVEDDGRVTGARPRHGNATEPPRVYRRLHFLRGWGDEHVKEIFTGSSGACGAAGD